MLLGAHYNCQNVTHDRRYYDSKPDLIEGFASSIPMVKVLIGRGVYTILLLYNVMSKILCRMVDAPSLSVEDVSTYAPGQMRKVLHILS